MRNTDKWRRCPNCNTKTELTVTVDGSDVIVFCPKCQWEV